MVNCCWDGFFVVVFGFFFQFLSQFLYVAKYYFCSLGYSFGIIHTSTGQ